MIAIIGLAIVGVMVAVLAVKRISPMAWGWYGPVNAPGGVAIGGYDPVAYHKSGQPTAGNPGFAITWGGARWLFATAENRSLFEGNQEKYAPQFGGFCGFAASKGFTAKTDPTAWRIEQGRLYLFNDHAFRDRWVSELGQGVINRGERAWATHVR